MCRLAGGERAKLVLDFFERYDVHGPHPQPPRATAGCARSRTPRLPVTDRALTAPTEALRLTAPHNPPPRFASFLPCSRCCRTRTAAARRQQFPRSDRQRTRQRSHQYSHSNPDRPVVSPILFSERCPLRLPRLTPLRPAASPVLRSRRLNEQVFFANAAGIRLFATDGQRTPINSRCMTRRFPRGRLRFRRPDDWPLHAYSTRCIWIDGTTGDERGSSPRRWPNFHQGRYRRI